MQFAYEARVFSWDDNDQIHSTFSVVLRTKDQLGVTDSECIQSSNFQFCDNFLLDKNPNLGILTIDSIKKSQREENKTENEFQCKTAS